MSQYYCKLCHCELNTLHDLDDIECPVCEHEMKMESIMLHIPDFESPAQYKKRTGREWPEKAPIWVKGYWDRGWQKGDEWTLTTNDKYLRKFFTVVCAQSPNPPPDDFVPEQIERLLRTAEGEIEKVKRMNKTNEEIIKAVTEEMKDTLYPDEEET